MTQKPAYWLLPVTMNSVKFSEVRDIDLSAAKTLKKQVDKARGNPLNVTCSAKNTKRPVPETTEEIGFILLHCSWLLYGVYLFDCISLLSLSECVF